MIKIYEKRCKICGGRFESKRQDALYCCDKCRQNSVRKGKNVTDNVTDNQEQLFKDLDEKSLKELEKQGYWIPNWKRKKKTKEKAMIDLLALTEHLPSRWIFQSVEYDTN